MRLEEQLQITETTRMADELKDIKKDFKQWFTVLAKALDKAGWEINDEDLLKILNAITMPDGVEFVLWKRKSAGAYFSGAQFGGKPVERDIYFTVYTNPGFAEYFRRFVKPSRRKMFLDINQNAFLRELFDILAHETTHAMQTFAISDKGNPETYAAKQKEQDIKGDPNSYYTDPREIEAYALQAAIEYARLNQSTIIAHYKEMFKETQPKIWKKFLKKYTFYKGEIKKSGLIFALANLGYMRSKRS